MLGLLLALRYRQPLVLTGNVFAIILFAAEASRYSFAELAGASVIAEFIEESLPPSEAVDRLMPAHAADRVEVRRLANWLNGKFEAEVSGPLVLERVFKRYMTREQGGGSPDTDAPKRLSRPGGPTRTRPPMSKY